MSDYTFFAQLDSSVPNVPTDSIISRTIFKNERLHAIMFGFAPGQELSEHTSAYPAVLHFITGQARLTLGSDEKTAVPGTWVHMPPRLPHSIVAETAVTMMLLMLRSDGQP